MNLMNAVGRFLSQLSQLSQLSRMLHISMVKDGSCLERSLRRAKPATQQEAVCISGIFFCLEALDGAFGDFEAGFEDGFFIVAHEHLIFEEARATGGTRGILLARPFHVLKLVK